MLRQTAREPRPRLVLLPAQTKRCSDPALARLVALQPIAGPEHRATPVSSVSRFFAGGSAHAKAAVPECRTCAGCPGLTGSQGRADPISFSASGANPAA